MKANKIILALAIFIIISTLSYFLYSWLLPSYDLNYRSKAEQNILSKLIDNDQAFEENTTFGDAVFTSDVLQYIRDGMPGLEENTLADFLQANNQPYPLKDYLPTNRNYFFLGNSDTNLYYNDWRSFSSKYPGLLIVESFSRAGFNRSLTQALVLKSSHARLFDEPFEYSGSGLLCFFRRIGTIWILQNQLVVSIMG